MPWDIYLTKQCEVMLMRFSKKFLPIVLAVSILIVLGIVSFFTATNWVFLTAKEPVLSTGTATTPGSGITTDPAGIKCKLTNYAIRPVYYGARFSVEKWVEDRWEEMPAPEGLRFSLGISVVWPFSSVELFYPASLFTESSGDGLYRVVLNVWVGYPQNAKEHPLYCEFTVSPTN
jgi:hypothetical protein